MEVEKAEGPARSGADKSKAAFLSHSSEETEMAQGLCASLEALGVSCWIAPRDILPGQPWALECLRGVAESGSLVLLLSEKALSSVQVLSEVEQAHKRARPIYTVLIPPAKVRGEMDFYLSRLHWMQSAGKTNEEIAATLAAVLGHKRDWKEIAAPPTLRRTMQYRPVAFIKLLTTSVLALVLVLGAGLYALDRMLNLDFRRLGYVDLAVEALDGGRGMMAHAQVWVMSPQVRFRDVRLRTESETATGATSQGEFAAWEAPEQIGGDMEEMPVPLEQEVRQLTTCLIIPGRGPHQNYRVTQRFVLTPAKDGVRVAETADKKVTADDGPPCGVRP